MKIIQDSLVTEVANAARSHLVFKPMHEAVEHSKNSPILLLMNNGEYYFWAKGYTEHSTKYFAQNEYPVAFAELPAPSEPVSLIEKRFNVLKAKIDLEKAEKELAEELKSR